MSTSGRKLSQFSVLQTSVFLIDISVTHKLVSSLWTLTLLIIFHFFFALQETQSQILSYPLHTLQAGVLRASVFPLSLLIPYPAVLLSWISSIDFLTEYFNLVKSFYRMIWDVDQLIKTDRGKKSKYSSKSPWLDNLSPISDSVQS